MTWKNECLEKPTFLDDATLYKPQLRRLNVNERVQRTVVRFQEDNVRQMTQLLIEASKADRQIHTDQKIEELEDTVPKKFRGDHIKAELYQQIENYRSGYRPLTQDELNSAKPMAKRDFMSAHSPLERASR